MEELQSLIHELEIHKKLNKKHKIKEEFREERRILLAEIERLQKVVDKQGIDKKRKTKENRYAQKKGYKERLKELSKYQYTVYYDKDKNRHIRIYFSRRRKFAKQQSKVKVRRNKEFRLEGGGYRKVFDYWWCIF